jgi:hypothetical protein
MLNRLAAAVAAIIMLSQSANAQLLKGGVESDASKPVEHCICLNPNKVHAIESNGEWQLIDDARQLFKLRTAEAANGAVDMIKTYGASEICSLGNSKAFNPNSIYFKTRNDAPAASLANEDAIRYDVDSIKAEQRNGSWKVTSAGDTWLLDFGPDEESARNAADIIRFYGFNNQCFVVAPARELMYWHK